MFSAAFLWGLRQESRAERRVPWREAAARLGIPPEGEEPLCGWEFRRKAGILPEAGLPCGHGGFGFVWRLGRLRRGAAVWLGVPRRKAGILPEAGCLRARAVLSLSLFGPPPARQGQGQGCAPLGPPHPITPAFPGQPHHVRRGWGAPASDRAPMPGATTAGPQPHILPGPCPASLRASQVLRAFAVSVCFMLVGRQCNCVRRGWGAARPHTFMPRSTPAKSHIRAPSACWMVLASPCGAGNFFFLRSGCCPMRFCGE